MLEAVAVVLGLQLLAVLAAAVLVVLMALQILVVVGVEPQLAVQALSFFATPAQFNISLVAQFPLTADM
jgi:hypothetical protein